ncbi:MAG: glycoside hydrolase family 3 C-terminal domain-containing protein [Blautia sp.]|nr:glycoside hydrolase family 3 C-terminal domain-containing protein [Blautia sp.]MCM1199825.1 glycoside hydrolase family 3 C-terminal domain-containing protein [Bacteroides fragilis]
MKLNIRSDKKTEDQIEKLLKEMTLDEKAAMIHGAGLFQTGAVERLGIPPLKCSDGPMGVRNEFCHDKWIPAGNNDDYVTYMPSGSALASAWNRELAYQSGYVLGEEARGRGKDVILAPGINIKRNPLCGRNFEYMSEDPKLTADLAVPFIRGVQENDVAACVKHFACNVQETDRLTVDTAVDDRTLYEIYFPAFRAAVQEGGSYSLMGAYNKINGTHCCENGRLLDLILREEWGYDGMVISDWGAVHRTKESAMVTMDVEMSVHPDFDEYRFANPLKEAVRKGEIPEAAVDAKIRNILRMMLRLKMIGKQRDIRKAGAYNTPAHREVTLRVAEESMILLKNEKNKLPLEKKKIRKLAVIGQNAAKLHSDGGGSAEIKALYEICPLMGMKAYLGGSTEVLYAPGYYMPEKPETFDTNWQEKSLDGQEKVNAAAGKEKEEKLIREKNPALFEEAVRIAKEVDEVIFIGGLNHYFDSEGLDRADMKLPYEQDMLIEELLKVRKDTVIALIGGSPVEMPWRYKAETILWSYYAGMETGKAFAEILFGEVNPSGKLAETFPARYEDCAAAKSRQSDPAGSISLSEGLYVGYRYYNKERIMPAFCFGHGLSYTQFSYQNLSIKQEKDGMGTVKVSFSVKNTGKRAGAEIAQLYVAPIAPKAERPAKELKAFTKIRLQPGKSAKVTLTLSHQDFAYFDSNKHDFTVNVGDYEILIGASCEDIRLKSLYTL